MECGWGGQQGQGFVHCGVESSLGTVLNRAKGSEKRVKGDGEGSIQRVGSTETKDWSGTETGETEIEETLSPDGVRVGLWNSWSSGPTRRRSGGEEISFQHFVNPLV